MELWIIALIVGLLLVAGIVVSVTTLTAADEPEEKECKSCGQACTADKNCGLASCGAVSGGSCGCADNSAPPDF